MSLTDEFFEAVMESCGFLCSRFDAVRALESTEWLATASFSGVGFDVEISYGDRELLVQTVVGRDLKGRPGRSAYGLWEWLEALDVQDRDVDEIGVSTAEQLRQAVSRSARLLEQHLLAILEAGPPVTSRIETARELRGNADLEASRAREHSRAAAFAAEAFRAKQFSAVIALLEPFEQRLSPSERKRLQLARRSVASSEGAV